jgi:putative ABC transport system permease protein
MRMVHAALNRKLLREIMRLRGQMFSIALVVAAGVMTVVSMRGTYVSLAGALDRFYRDYRFADVFVELNRAPLPVAARVEALPGVATVETRVRQIVNLDVPGLEDAAIGLMLSVSARPDDGGLNAVHLVAGRWLDPERPDEVLASESFMTANALELGATLGAVINGRWRRLEVVGIAISPDYIGEVAPGTIFPDDRRFAILRMHRPALAAAAGMEGAFNELSVKLAPHAREAEVMAGLDRVLEPYGGRGAYGRATHMSHAGVTGEIEQNRVTGTIIPAIFLGVAAFLLNIVLSRLVSTQREEIAVLKAFGYSNTDIGRHFLRFALVPVVAGAVAGTLVGVWMGEALTQLYGRYFRFPDLHYVMDWKLFVGAAGISVAAAAAGALGAVRRAVALPPAEAMRPEAPARFSAGLLERAGLGRWLAASGRMILRNVERRPARSLMSALGVAFSVAILVVSLFFFDAITHMLDVQFRQVQREDLAVTFASPRPLGVGVELARLPEVNRVELHRTVPVELSHGHRRKATVLHGMQDDGELRRIVDQKRGPVQAPATGLLLNSKLAGLLDARVGDTIALRSLEGRRQTRSVAVVGLVEELFGISAYMELDAMHTLLGESPRASGAFLATGGGSLAATNAAVKEMPAVASAHSPAVLRRTFEEQMDETLLVSVMFLVVLAGILAVGVIYNGARIALSERGRELASLRVLGFTRREISVLLLGEQGAITLLAIPLGWVIGFGIGAGIIALFDMEAYRIPLVITPGTYLYSALVALAAALFAGLAVRTRLNRLNLIEVLKTRE